MLVLNIRKDSSVMVGDDIEITVTKVGRNTVKLTFDAPDEVKIYRKEIYDVKCNSCRCKNDCDFPERKDARGCTGHTRKESK